MDSFNHTFQGNVDITYTNIGVSQKAVPPPKENMFFWVRQVLDYLVSEIQEHKPHQKNNLCYCLRGLYKNSYKTLLHKLPPSSPWRSTYISFCTNVSSYSLIIYLWIFLFFGLLYSKVLFWSVFYFWDHMKLSRHNQYACDISSRPALG